MTPQDRLVRVVLVDDQELVRSGLRRILRRRDGFEIVAECGDGGDVPEALDRLADGTDAGDDPGVDVVVMDLRMRQVDGITATAGVVARSHGPAVLVLTTFDDDEMLSGALRAGAAGFLLKDSSADDLARAIRTVAVGDSWLDPAVTARVLTRYRAAPEGTASTDAAAALTDRELEVLRAMGSGASNQEIAAALVRAHRAALPEPEELLGQAAPGEPRVDPRTGHRGGFEDTVWFRLAIGRKQNADPRWILPILCRRGHITRNEIGAIRIGPEESFVQIPRPIAGKFADALKRTAAAELAAGEESLLIEPSESGPRDTAPARI